MFHSKKLITEAALPSLEEPQSVAALPPRARPPGRRPLWFALGGAAIAAVVGGGWLMERPACACGLPPIKPINLAVSGHMTQAAPVGSALANKGSTSHSALLRPAAVQPRNALLLNQPAQAGTGVPF